MYLAGHLAEPKRFQGPHQKESFEALHKILISGCALLSPWKVGRSCPRLMAKLTLEVHDLLDGPAVWLAIVAIASRLREGVRLGGNNIGGTLYFVDLWVA